MRFLGVLVLSCLVPGVMFLAPRNLDSLTVLVHWPTVLLVLGGSLAVLLISQSARRWRLFLRCIGRQTDLLDRADRQALIGFLSSGSRAALAVGLVGQIFGLAVMLGNLADPDSMGSGAAVSLMSVLYGVLLSEIVFHPLRKTHARQLHHDPPVPAV